MSKSYSEYSHNIALNAEERKADFHRPMPMHISINTMMQRKNLYSHSVMRTVFPVSFQEQNL